MKKISILIICLSLILCSCNFSDENLKSVGNCSFSIKCETILSNKDSADKSILDFIPDNGIIFSNDNIEISEGDTPFSVLKKICKSNNIKLNFSENSVSGTVYVTEINNISSGDCGDLSGWLYLINDESASEAANMCIIKDGDVIEWVYTCDMGNDI